MLFSTGFFIKFLYIILAIVILLVMVAIHEFGHYIAGKILKFKINEFSIGFGPKIVSKKRKSGEMFSLRAIPLGGYCAFEGDADDSESKDRAEKPSSDKAFNLEKPWKRIIVFFAGAFFNIVSAVIFSFIFILIVGYAVPRVDDVYTNINTHQPYCLLEKGDEIVAVNGKKINVLNSFESMVANISVGDTVTVTVFRDGETIDLDITKQIVTAYDSTIDDNVDYEGFGIKTFRIYEKAGFIQSLGSSVPFTLKLSWSILGLFGDLITGKVALTSLTGPVGTVNEIANKANEDARNILILLPLIASNLAVFNLLPFPALDGSRIVFTTIEWIRKKPVKPSIENAIHFAGMIFIFGLVILIDLIRVYMSFGG